MIKEKYVTMLSIFEFEKTMIKENSFRVIHKFEFDGYRRVWTSEARKMIVTYCEGDIITQRFTSIEEYQQELKRQAAFYENY